MREIYTGIVRRMDELGRVVIPKNIRDTVGFKADQPFEIILDDKGRVILEHAKLADYASHKKNALFFTAREFNRVLVDVFGEEISATYELDGITISDGYDCVDDKKLHKSLAYHFGVSEVTSIHIDDCEEVGVWVVYK